MKTDALIRALAADAATPPDYLGPRMAKAIVPGLIVALILFMALLGPRPTAIQSLESIRFVWKFVETLALGFTMIVAVLRLSRPDGAPGWLVLLAPMLLLASVAGELLVLPPAQWTMAIIGKNGLVCLTFVPILSAPILIAALVALRAGAPSHPALAGAAAGMLAGGFAASLYASHCTDDSPLFVATWYPIAIGIVAIVGALVGSRALRW